MGCSVGEIVVCIRGYSVWNWDDGNDCGCSTERCGLAFIKTLPAALAPEDGGKATLLRFTTVEVN
jgi:hypothetical protein